MQSRAAIFGQTMTHQISVPLRIELKKKVRFNEPGSLETVETIDIIWLRPMVETDLARVNQSYSPVLRTDSIGSIKLSYYKERFIREWSITSPYLFSSVYFRKREI